MARAELHGPGAEERRLTGRLRHGDVESAWRLFQALPSTQLNEFHLGAVVAAVAKAAAWQRGYGAMEVMVCRTLPAGLICQNAALTSLPDWRKCIHAFDTQASRDQITCNSVIYGCAKGLHWTGSLHLLAMRSFRHADAYGFTSAIDAASRTDRWRMSFSLLGSMAALNDFSLASAAKLPGAVWHKSIQLLAAMELHFLRRSEVMIGSVISSFESASQWIHAFELLHLAVRRRLSSLISCSSALSSGEKAGQWQAPLQIFQQMSEWLLQADEICLGAMVSACDKGGQWDLALLALGHSSSQRLVCDIITWNSAISACERRRRWPMALLLAHRWAGTEGLTAAVSACGKGGLWQRALSLSETLEAPDLVLHNSLLSACVRGAAVDAAAWVARRGAASFDLLLAMYETLQDASSALELLAALRTSVLDDCRRND